MGQVKFGLKNIHYAVYNSETSKYATPVSLPGAKSLTTEYDGDTSNFYADDGVYYTTVDSSSITGTLTVADMLEAARIALLGDIKDSTTGMLMENMSADPAEFALMGEISGDPKKRRFVYYSCKLGRPSTEANTREDTTEPDTDELSFTAMGKSYTIDGAECLISKATVMEGDSAYDSWFSAVTEPSATTTA